MDTYLSFDDEDKLKNIIHKNTFNWLSQRCKNLGLIPSKSKILDLGCGHGNMSLALSHHFHTVYGVDPSIKMLKYARNLRKRAQKFYTLTNVRFYLGDFENIPIKQLDVICLFNSIHFSKQVMKDLIYILSFVKQGGIIVISEPSSKSTFGSKLMEDNILLKKKIKILKKVLLEIKLFLKWCIEHKKASIIIESKTDKKYFVLLQKL